MMCNSKYSCYRWFARFEIEQLIINCLLYSGLKGICSYDGILKLIPMVRLITLFDRGKWQYTVFRGGIKDIVSKCLNALGLFSVLTMLVFVSHLFSFSTPINN